MNSLDSLDWSTSHPAIHRNTNDPSRAVVATTRPHGALRYQCPINGSLVLVTDDATLARLNRPNARLRCIDCGEIHVLTRADEASAAHFTAGAFKSAD